MTTTISKFELGKGYTRPGPWGCTYRVTARTAAVNVAQHGKYLAEFEDTGHVFNPIELGLQSLLDVAGDGSIHGFWGRQISLFTPEAVEAVKAEAARLIEQDRDAGYGSPQSLAEQDDGQR